MLVAALPLVGGLVLILAGLEIRRLARLNRPVRLDPWPGVSAHGANLLLTHSLLIAAGQLLLGAAEFNASARSALPWLPLASLLAIGPLVLAARLAAMPGALSAVAGAYLLPRSALSLVAPEVAPPLALWPSAFALGLALWIRRSDVAAVASTLWPRRLSPAERQRRAWAPPAPPRISFSPRRAAIGGFIAGALLGLVEPTYEVLLGSDPGRWAPQDSLIGGTLAAVASAVVAYAIAAAPAQRVAPR